MQRQISEENGLKLASFLKGTFLASSVSGTQNEGQIVLRGQKHPKDLHTNAQAL